MMNRAKRKFHAHMQEAGAEGIIERCTESVMLIQQEHTDIP